MYVVCSLYIANVYFSSQFKLPILLKNDYICGIPINSGKKLTIFGLSFICTNSQNLIKQ
jgi:hypothetical protein